MHLEACLHRFVTFDLTSSVVALQFTDSSLSASYTAYPVLALSFHYLLLAPPRTSEVANGLGHQMCCLEPNCPWILLLALQLHHSMRQPTACFGDPSWVITRVPPGLRKDFSRQRRCSTGGSGDTYRSSSPAPTSCFSQRRMVQSAARRLSPICRVRSPSGPLAQLLGLEWES